VHSFPVMSVEAGDEELTLGSQRALQVLILHQDLQLVDHRQEEDLYCEVQQLEGARLELGEVPLQLGVI
jgi:hypothetical protein